MRLRGERPYLLSRKAYLPRIWPIGLLASVLSFLLSWFLSGQLGLWIVPLQLALAATIGLTRAWVWRHRHPLIPMEQLVAEHMEDIRRKAVWN